jgi:formylglycine-generating enzyme required for sulfatase activity
MKAVVLFLLGLASSASLEAAPGAKKAAEAKESKVWQEPSSGMPFVAIPKGCFKMGASTPQPPQAEIFWERAGYTKSASEDEVPVHEVCVDAFWLGKYEVRAEEWQRLMGGPSPSQGQPAAGVTWQQAQEFVARLNQQAGGAWRFRLPTEAEWEYACRAGRHEDVDPLSGEQEQLAWYRFKTSEPQAVGQLQANGFGAHDMLGNVWEWVRDSYDADGYRKHALYNPVVEAGSTQRVLRGGSFRTERVQTRCAMRGHASPDAVLGTAGFRLVREP